MSKHFPPNWVSLIFTAGCLLAGGVWLGRSWNPPPLVDMPVTEKVDVLETTPGIVHLPDSKRIAAGIEVAVVEPRPMHRVNIVPGRVQYDDTRHVEIKAATDGVLTQGLVKPGDNVE
ncbi:MAG: hypothetical protein NT069_21460, partial [Planctomycetota bacterium]|nr:hypothetical protein [Planctomycetota bacterium]